MTSQFTIYSRMRYTQGGTLNDGSVYALCKSVIMLLNIFLFWLIIIIIILTLTRKCFISTKQGTLVPKLNLGPFLEMLEMGTR